MTRNRKMRKLTRMSRRGFMNALAGLGVSSSAIAGLSQDTMAELVEDRKNEVPRVAAHVHTNHEEVKNGAEPIREPIYYTIPRRKWARVEGAHDAQLRIQKQLSRRSESHQVWLTNNSNGESLIEIRLEDDGSLTSHSLKSVESTIPSTIDGVAGSGTNVEEKVPNIPVTVVRETSSESVTTESDLQATSGDDPGDEGEFWQDWKGIPGGATVAREIYGQVTTETICCPVHNSNDGNKHMLTSGHTASSSPQWAATPPYDQPDFSHELSRDEWKHGVEVDYGALSLADEDSNWFVDRFATSNGDYHGTIKGTVSNDRLKDLRQEGSKSNETLRFQGSTSGRHSGYDIESLATYENNNGENIVLQFETELDTKGGDSGGPYHMK